MRSLRSQALTLPAQRVTECSSRTSGLPDIHSLFFLTNKIPILFEQQHTCLKILNFTDVSLVEVTLCNRVWPKVEVLGRILLLRGKVHLEKILQAYTSPENWEFSFYLTTAKTNPTLRQQNSKWVWPPGLLVAGDKFNPSLQTLQYNFLLFVTESLP